MLPFQMREAIEKKVPVILSIGTLEYHSEHLPFGVDTQIIEGVFKRLEKRHPEIVVLPPFYYGTASYAVAGPENGCATLNIDSMHLCNLAEDLFRNLLEIGFRNIHGFVYHQTENFAQGMPCDLAFRFAGRRAIFEFLERTRGRGWWGNPTMSKYYEENIFDSILIHRLSEGVRDRFGGDHAGKVETSAMMELHPDLVHMELRDAGHWYAQSAKDASKEFGHAYIEAILEQLEKTLSLEKSGKK